MHLRHARVFYVHESRYTKCLHDLPAIIIIILAFASELHKHNS